MPKTSSKLMMIAGGIGITPLMAMLRSLALEPNPKITDIALIYCVQTSSDLVYYEELSTLKLPNFETHFILSQEKTAQDTKNTHHTRISATWIQNNIRNGKEYEIFLCGPEGFMKGVLNSLNQLKFDMDKCHLERFNF
jgi:ferredoxin-NADP reductase